MATQASTCPAQQYFCRRRGLRDSRPPEPTTLTAKPASRPMRLATAAAISVFVGSLALGVLAGSLWTFAGAEWAARLAMPLAPALFAGALAYVAALRIAKLGSQVGVSGQMGMYELETRIAQGGMGEVWR